MAIRYQVIQTEPTHRKSDLDQFVVGQDGVKKKDVLTKDGWYMAIIVREIEVDEDEEPAKDLVEKPEKRKLN